jgi:hypothetical protein
MAHAGHRPCRNFAANRFTAMNAIATNPQTPDDARLWSPSLVDAVGSGMPRQDPVAQLLAEEHHDRARLRLMLSAAASILILVVGAGVLT